MNPRPSIVVFILSLFPGLQATAQMSPEYSAAYHSVLSRSSSVYYRQLGDQSALFNGSRYIAYSYEFKSGTPFYQTNTFTNGSVVYNGILYDSVALLYEDLREYLVVKNKDFLLQLVSERISEFTISGHSFIRIIADSSNKNLFKTGFYEILYTGPSGVMKKTSKKMVELAGFSEGLHRTIDETDSYYVKSGASWVQINSMEDLLNCFQKHKKEVQHFVKKNKLKFKKNPENTVYQVAGYYDQIAN